MLVMGRRWGPDAVWKNVYTNDLSIGIALDESSRLEGLLYVGTDDGLIQISENGGESWRRIERFPGVPELTYVSEVLASRHDANVVYAAFNNQWRGDFTPYVLKSTDRGGTWTSIRANLPDRNQVWTLAEDHVNPDLLFAGTEHGLYVTVNGGQSWSRMRGGLPTVPVRDIELQRRENDIVLGTFGRGIYILDDYTPLRALTPRLLEEEATLFAPRPAKLFHPTPYQRGGAGSELFTGQNPPYGAILTYNIGRALPRGAELVITVADAAGSVVREMTAPASVGLQRVVWNLRRNPPPAPTVARGGGPGGGQGRQVQGELVSAGPYTVQLNRRVSGALTAIGAPQRVDVVPLQTGA
jgi:hypothetical protein